MLALDTRTSASGRAVEIFSGMVYCGECGSPMVRKTVPSAKKKYVYYVCAAHKNEKTCSAHSLRDIALNEIVLESLKRHIQEVIDSSELLEMTDTARLQQASIQKLKTRLELKQMEIDRYQKILRSLCEDKADGIIDSREYRKYKEDYTRQREEAEEQAEAVRREMDRELGNFSEGREWMRQFRRQRNLTALDRAAVVTLIERVMIFRGHRAEIVYRWRNEFQYQAEMLERARTLSPEKEAF